MLLIPRCRVSSVRKRRKITWNHHPRLSFQLEISRENTDLTKIWGRERRKKRRVGKEFDRYSISFFFFFHGIDESSWAGIDGEAQKDREKCREPFFFHFMFHILHIRLWLGDRCADWMVKAWVFVQGWRVKSRFFSNKRESKLIFDMIFWVILI